MTIVPDLLPERMARPAVGAGHDADRTLVVADGPAAAAEAAAAGGVDVPRLLQVPAGLPQPVATGSTLALPTAGVLLHQVQRIGHQPVVTTPRDLPDHLHRGGHGAPPGAGRRVGVLAPASEPRPGDATPAPPHTANITNQRVNTTNSSRNFGSRRSVPSGRPHNSTDRSVSCRPSQIGGSDGPSHLSGGRSFAEPTAASVHRLAGVSPERIAPDTSVRF